MLYEKLSAQIIKAALSVLNTLGNGFLEAVYQKALFHHLKLAKIDIEMEKRINVFYLGKNVGNYYADILVDDKIIVEIKCVERISIHHINQVKNYLAATGLKVGLLFNFKHGYLEFNRIYPA